MLEGGGIHQAYLTEIESAIAELPLCDRQKSLRARHAELALHASAFAQLGRSDGMTFHGMDHSLFLLHHEATQRIHRTMTMSEQEGPVIL